MATSEKPATSGDLARRGEISSSAAFHALALAEIGKMLLLTDGEEKGVDLLNEALAIHKQIGDQSGQANVGIALASYYAAKRDLPKAIDHLQPVADFGKSIGHPLGDEHQARIDAWRKELESGEATAAGER